MRTIGWIALIACLMALALLWPTFMKKLKIRRWYRDLSLYQHDAIFHQLYADVDGFSLSREARAQKDAMEYVYGEIEFVSFIALLALANPNSETIFYDLGSGTGKAVLACAMVFNVHKSYGIELFTKLHKTALKQQQRLQQIPGYSVKATTITFINENFLQADFSDATLIFINATAFFGDTWARLNQRLETLTTTPTVITTSKKLRCASFVLIRVTKVRMSWGVVSAYIYQPMTALLC